VHISETQCTNTLPIQRLGLTPGESADVSVAYFDGYELQPWPEPQRYTRFEEGDGGGMYRFVSLDGGFTADLTVDSDGLVVHYPRLFKRVFTLAATSQKPFGTKGREQPVHTLGTWRS